MKKLLFALFLLISAYFTTFAQIQDPQRLDSDVARISFINDTLDYGSIKFRSDGYRKIKYISTGKGPLVIWAVNGLGPRELIVGKKLLFPGDTGILKIYYPTGVAGYFHKILSIYSNAQTTKLFFIKGYVLPEEICAEMKFNTDFIDLGVVHYVYGKHFTIKVPSIGKCPLNITVTPGDEYLNVVNYNSQPIQPGDSGTIDIHLGGQVIGNYYGTITVYSSNAKTPQKAILLKGKFSPPDDIDTSLTFIDALNDVVDAGNTTKKRISVSYAIKNSGRKPLIFKKSGKERDIITVPSSPVLPGKVCNISVDFDVSNTMGSFIKHINLSGNFNGTTIPLYIKGNVKAD